MAKIIDFTQNPIFLLACLLLGGVCGLFAPSSLSVVQSLGELYIHLVGAAALPLLIVAVFFGLKQVMALPNAGVRLFTIVILTIAITFACSFLGALLASALTSGGGLTQADISQIGKLVSTLQDDASISLNPPREHNFSSKVDQGAEWNNFFHSLSFGSIFSVMIGALAFGLAFAVQSGTSARTLTNLFETIYRALEWLILRLNIFLPLVAFTVAATATASVGSTWIFVMLEFLFPYFLAVLLVVFVVIVVIARNLGVGLSSVLNALSAPMTVVTLSGSAGATAALPVTIDAMGSRLGFNRGLVELVMPTSAVFLKAGDALFISMLAVFVANLYGKPVSISDLGFICALSVAAAFMAVDGRHGKTLALSAVVLAPLGLPLEAVFPVFLILEIICEGPRNLLSLLMGCVIVAVASRGLHSERVRVENFEIERKYLFVMTNKKLYLAAGFFVLAMAVMLFAGVGLGIRSVNSVSPISGIGLIQ